MLLILKLNSGENFLREREDFIMEETKEKEKSRQGCIVHEDGITGLGNGEFDTHVHDRRRGSAHKVQDIDGQDPASWDAFGD